MPVSSTEMLGIFKEYYSPDQMEQLLFRNSPFVKKIEKRRVTGKTYNYPVLSGMGGAVSGSGTVAVAQSTTTARSQQSAATYGNLFAAFQLTEKEILASQNEKGAFEPAGVVKMFAACEAARKQMAACAYGSGYGELGQVVGAVAPAAVTMVVDDSTLVKMDVGTVFSITDNSTGHPGDPLQGAPDTFTVTKIDSDGSGVNTVTFTPGATAGTGFPDNSWIEINGGRSGATAYMPVGLSGIIPHWFDRTGVAWGTYIGTAFFGVDRSTATSRLAGGFVLRNTGAGEKRYQAITRAVKLARRQGSEADLIVMNDNDYSSVVNELEADRQFWQALNTSGKASGNEVVVGMEQMGYQQASSWVKTVIDDPYCPCFIAYVLETRTMRFVALSNVEKVTQDGIADNSPGAPPITKDGDTPTNQYALLIEDILTLNPLTVGVDGPGLQALLSVFGSYVVQNPAHCVVVNLVS
jgi:hypothetical protein